MSHYQFETLHPFHDSNGRLGRLLVVLRLVQLNVLTEPTLTVSPWFEARRTDHYARLLAVSAEGDCRVLRRRASRGSRQHPRADAQTCWRAGRLKQLIRASPLRADSAHASVNFAVASPSFSDRKVELDLGISYGRANKLISQLVDLGVLDVLDPKAYKRRFYAPVLAVLTGQA